MNQEKIGKFICYLRKENKMTQQELAEKLNVTDRAISNWENGKNMPDLSLFKPICDIFNISINELLSGEKLQENEYQEKLEENIINTVIFEKNKRKVFKKIILSSLSVITFIILFIFGSLFIIDNKRMSNDKPVVFSTWGNKNYWPMYEYKKQDMEKSIKRYFLTKMDKIYTNYNNETFNLVNFVVVHTFLIDIKSDDEIIVYLWAIYGSRLDKNYDDEIINPKGVISSPYKIVLKKTNDGYEILNVYAPNDKTKIDYVDSYLFIKNYFPKNIFKKVANYDKTLLDQEFYNLIENYVYQ